MGGRIAFDLGVESEKTRLKLGNVRTHGFAMRHQQLAAFAFRGGALRAQLCVAQHALDRHAGLLQAAQKREPIENRPVVGTLPRRVAQCKRNQPDALVVADRVDGKPRHACQIANLHVFSLNDMRDGGTSSALQVKRFFCNACAVVPALLWLKKAHTRHAPNSSGAAGFMYRRFTGGTATPYSSRRPPARF